jgi:hypothetical protein
MSVMSSMALAKTIRSYAELVQMLVEAGVAHDADPGRQTVDVPPDTSDLPGPTHLRWEKRHPFLQLIQPIVLGVPRERVRDIETAVVRLNNVSLHPGIEFDHGTSTVYHRVTAVVLVDGIRLDLIQAYLQGLLIKARQLRPTFLQIVGGLSGDEILRVAPGDLGGPTLG